MLHVLLSYIFFHFLVTLLGASVMSNCLSFFTKHNENLHVFVHCVKLLFSLLPKCLRLFFSFCVHSMALLLMLTLKEVLSSN